MIKNVHRLVTSLATVNATLVSAGNRRLQLVHVVNTNAAVRYLKLYNKATAPDENDTPKMTLALPASSVPFTLNLGNPGVAFPLGIGYRMTTAAADNSTAAVGTDILGLNIGYA